MNKINLAYGNPAFMRDYWKEQDLPELDAYYTSSYMNEKHSPELEVAIRRIHKAVKNVKNVDNYHVVIGNGATQLLSTVIYETFEKKVSAPAPYFLRFPVLAEIGQNMWVDAKFKYLTKMILTAPNNPDGTFELYDKYKSNNQVNIVDACYNWPQYGNIRELDDDILIFSLSKATGHAGARLGWALVKNKLLADDMTRSVEMTTMGVSNLSQEVGRFVLNREAQRIEEQRDNCFRFTKKVLDYRWKKLKEAHLPFEVLNKNGMFAWCKGTIPDHVEGILGSQFGVSNEYFRLNIGCQALDFIKFIEPYLKEDEDE